jgi:hypothetical protein
MAGARIPDQPSRLPLQILQKKEFKSFNTIDDALMRALTISDRTTAFRNEMKLFQFREISKHFSNEPNGHQE